MGDWVIVAQGVHNFPGKRTWLALGHDHEGGSRSAEQVTALRRL